MNSKLYSLLIAGLFSLTTVAQITTANGDEQPKTVVALYDQVIKTSNNYNNGPKRYKVIDRNKLDAFRTQLKDSVTGLKAQIVTLDEVIANQNAEVAGLNASLTATQGDLDATRAEKDSMSLFGLQMSKTAYNGLLWGIIAVLFLGLLFFMSRFKNSNAVTKDAQHKLNEAEAEFETYRKKALEKEQKMGRMLQDERNKLAKSSKA